MKKVYNKPEIVFESFSMSTNIAGDCDKIITTFQENKSGCALPGSDPMFPVFTNEMTDCVVKQSTDDYNGFCYHVPEDPYELFNS